MFALGHDPTKFAGSNKVKTPKTPIVMQTGKGWGQAKFAVTLLLLAELKIPSSQPRARGRSPPRAPSPVFMHPETRPSRAAYAYTPSGSGPREAYLSRKRSQRSLHEEMDLGGNPQSHRRGSPFVAIGNQLAMTRPSPPAAQTSAT
jgi:hypothetical protein